MRFPFSFPQALALIVTICIHATEEAGCCTVNPETSSNVLTLPLLMDKSSPHRHQKRSCSRRRESVNGLVNALLRGDMGLTEPNGRIKRKCPRNSRTPSEARKRS